MRLRGQAGIHKRNGEDGLDGWIHWFVGPTVGVGDEKQQLGMGYSLIYNSWLQIR